MAQGETTATLRFSPSATPEGFSSANISELGKKDAYSAIRELIQNAMDAALDREQNQAIIRFTVGKVSKVTIPGIEEYTEALEFAEDFLSRHGDFGGPNRKILDSIKSALDEEYLPVLFVEDNGVGLDPNRMNRILSDGFSNKGTSNSGSYGVGHYTAFGLTSLRYLLYGGINDKDEKIASGHAILASHQAKSDEARGKDGFLLVGDIRNDLFEPYPYATGNKIPALLNDRLNKIKDRWGAGSCIAILGFNFFGDEMETVQECIEDVSVQNFFAAIHRGTLAIQIADGNSGAEPSSIKNSDLKRISKRWCKQANAKSKGFPSGRAASESINTLLTGKRAEIEEYGATIFWREQVDYKTKIVICRNGMWITDEFGKISKPELYRDKVLFDALVLLGNGQAAQIVRDAEPPLHNAIELKRLDKKGVNELNNFFVAVQEFLKKNVNSYDNETFEADDYISIPVGYNSFKKAHRDTGKKVRPKRPPRKPDGEKEKLRPGPDIRAWSIPNNHPNLHSLEIEPLEKHIPKDSRLYLYAHTGADDTCSGSEDNEQIPLLGVTIAGTNGVESAELEEITQDSRGKKTKSSFRLPQLKKGIAQQFDIKLGEDAPKILTFKVEIWEEIKLAEENNA